MTTAAPTIDTRDRLLEAAGEIFAENGFRKTTVRDICERAQANVAAVNYYFGDKAGLYEAVWRRLRDAVQPEAPTGQTAEGDLRARLRAILPRILADPRASLMWKLYHHELLDPTPALEGFIEQVVRPSHERWLPILRELLGPDAGAEEVELCMMSIVGQYLFYSQNRAIVARMQPHLVFDGPTLERLADHIAEFSLHALRGLSHRCTRIHTDD